MLTPDSYTSYWECAPITQWSVTIKQFIWWGYTHWYYEVFFENDSSTEPSIVEEAGFLWKVLYLHFWKKLLISNSEYLKPIYNLDDVICVARDRDHLYFLIKEDWEYSINVYAEWGIRKSLLSTEQPLELLQFAENPGILQRRDTGDSIYILKDGRISHAQHDVSISNDFRGLNMRDTKFTSVRFKEVNQNIEKILDMQGNIHEI